MASKIFANHIKFGILICDNYQVNWCLIICKHRVVFNLIQTYKKLFLVEMQGHFDLH